MEAGKLRVVELFAYVVVDADGHEGVLGRQGVDGQVPMITFTRAGLDRMRPAAVAAATEMKALLAVAHFVRSET